MSDDLKAEQSCSEVDNTNFNWELNGMEWAAKLIQIQGNIGIGAKNKEGVRMEVVDVLKKSGLNIQLLFMSDIEISVGFAEKDTQDLFKDSLFMFWERYKPKFHLDLLKREDQWWIQNDYENHRVGEGRDLLDSFEKLSVIKEHTLIEWLEEYGVEEFSLEFDINSGDVQILIASDRKRDILDAIGYEWQEREYPPAPSDLWGWGEDGEDVD